VWDQASSEPNPGIGLSDPEGSVIEPLEILVPADEPGLLRERYAEEIAVLGTELGIPIAVTTMPFEDLVSLVFSGGEEDNWDMYLLAWGPLPILPSYLFDMFRSDTDSDSRGVNSTGFSNEEFDALARQFDEARSQTEAVELISSAEAILASEVPSLFLFHPLIVEAFSDDLEMPFTNSPDGLQSWFQGVGLASAVGRQPAS
jgi:ABC-type transport system substrate-binding protein